MSRLETDELLLSYRLGLRITERGARVRCVGAVQRQLGGAAVEPSEKWAGFGPGRALGPGQALGPGRALGAIVGPSGNGRRRLRDSVRLRSGRSIVVLHATSSPQPRCSPMRA